MSIRTVLFDLDGTLADTGPDLAHALNVVRDEQARARIPYEHIRPIVSHGGIALLRLGFPELDVNGAEFTKLRNRMLEIYRANLARHTRLFPGMDHVLETIEARGMNWGVVTNKPEWLTNPLMEQLGLTPRAASIVSGDTTANKKPHPEPMLLACGQAGSIAAQCLYVGDAQRDIEAGRTAGMTTLVALFGYIGSDDRPEHWGADGLINDPREIIDWIS
jgi:phosphoglycolate phosphatase